VWCVYFFFSSRRRHTRSKRDWSSDVCSSDLFLYKNTIFASCIPLFVPYNKKSRHIFVLSAQKRRPRPAPNMQKIRPGPLSWSRSYWWAQSIQIRTAALRGSRGGHIPQSDGFEAILIVECNQNFFIIQINSIHECIDQRLTVTFDVRIQFAESGQPESHEVRAEFGLGQLLFRDPDFQLFLLGFQSFQPLFGRAGQDAGLDGIEHILDT